MEEKYLYQLAEFVLPVDLLNYFSIVNIEHDSSLLRIYLDEKKNFPMIFILNPKILWIPLR